MSTTVRTQQQPDYLGLLVAGYVMALLLPVGGVVVAFALSEKRLGHALGIACLSVVCGFGWFFLLFGH